ncbi:hypothetical protein DRE_04009 [Drechslerella stenobrocha 248]|uniref:Glucose-methanol-choline oxidoreductase N-terminal domain-containing protein n=1 Tax=Drechslerella stenobrocha 248 TaxID=1043628 RepID=W7HTL8_9PEZI|nr:hypothetical protein DRE_04009 [Drechslerella stenobrocha 248]
MSFSKPEDCPVSQATSFDYIIAGGGTAGLVVAARLTENPAITVAVIEAGEDRVSDLNILAPGLLTTLYGNPDYDWNFNSVPQPNANGRVYAHPRGKVLGGSSAINFLFWTHPSQKDINNWGALGNQDWSWDALKPYFEKSETYVAPTPEIESDLGTQFIVPKSHGTSGPIQTGFPSWYTDMTKQWPQTIDNMGLKVDGDPIDGLALGGYANLLNLDVSSGTRSYSATGYYAPNAGRTNLHVFTGALVTKVVLANQGEDVIATGVEFVRDGTTTTVHATKEVILSAGAFGSPQILELSGIGNPNILNSHNIPTLVENPNVGENLQDHAFVPLGFEVNDGVFTLDSFRDPAVFGAAFQEYLSSKTGPISASGVGSGLLSLRQIAGDDYKPDPSKYPTAPSANAGLADQHKLQSEDLFSEAVSQPVMLSVGIRPSYQDRPTEVFNSGLPEGNFISFLGVLEHPFSRGSVHIASADPATHPAIDPNYLSHPLDVELFCKIALHLQSIARTAPLNNVLKDGGTKYQPGYYEVTPDNVEGWVKKSVMSEFHPSGSCSMLPRDKGGVVDAKLKVYGVKNMRVVDASVFPLMVFSLQIFIALALIWEATAASQATANYSAPVEAVRARSRDCGQLLQHNRTLYSEIAYRGHLTNYFGSPDSDTELVAITYDGCLKVCGNAWRHSSQQALDLLLDWILPAIGLIAGMPWESNRNSVTVVWLARWIGSPIAALTFCLWDVKIASRCAKLVSITTYHRREIYHSPVTQPQADAEDDLEVFSESRDTFYILLVMNQFQLKRSAEQYLTPEELVTAVERALFSKEVVNGIDLVRERRVIASELRGRRKRGVIPTFLGLGGFFFAMAVAITKAFNTDSGESVTAFNVGLGLLIGWLPVLFLAAVVDNDHDNKPEFAKMFDTLVSACHGTGDVINIFGDGKGQGRGRWHYGIGQTIMSRIEDEFIETWTKGNPIDWEALRKSSPAPQRNIEFSHWRIIEPLLSAFIIVSGISSGSFILAYFTPPVGFAWRSAAYLTCLCIAVVIFLIDITLFKVVRHSFMTATTKVGTTHGPIYNFCKSVNFRRTAHFTLIGLEILNTLTLILLVVAMAAGLFNFCAGIAVNRGGPGGGVVILNNREFHSKYFDVASYYTLGILPGMILMIVATLYLIEQWFTQSFLWATKEQAGMVGLKRSRRWKWVVTLGGALEVGETIRWVM